MINLVTSLKEKLGNNINVKFNVEIKGPTGLRHRIDLLINFRGRDYIILKCDNIDNGIILKAIALRLDLSKPVLILCENIHGDRLDLGKDIRIVKSINELAEILKSM